MKPLDTSQSVTVFPKSVGVKMIAGGLLTIALGIAGIWLAMIEDQIVFAFLTGWLAPLGVWMTWVFYKRHKNDTPDPTVMLSPEGLHLMTGTTGVIPWDKVSHIGPYSASQLKGMIIHVDEQAFASLDQSKVFKASRKFDAAIGVHGLVFFDSQLELPLNDMADILHQYSIAHGGPPLQPAP